MKKIIKDALILFAITLIAGFALGGVYAITKAPIEQANQNRKEKAYKAVFERAIKLEAQKNGADVEKAVSVVSNFKFDELDAETVAKYSEAFIKELGDNTANTLDGIVRVDMNEYEMYPYGYVITVTNSEGYGGNIQMSVGIFADGTVAGVELLSIAETPGLGMNAKNDSFINQFSFVNTDAFAFTKTGKTADNEIDAISSATFTTKSVTNGVNAALAAYRAIMAEGGNN